MMTKRRSRNYVDREVQTTLLKRLSGHWALFVLANLAAVFLWTLAFETPDSTWQHALRTSQMRLVPFVIVSLAMVPVFVLDAVKLSNRFAGPIIRVRRALSQIAEGKTPKAIEFRSNDFWKSLANDLNRAFIFNFKNAPKNQVDSE